MLKNSQISSNYAQAKGGGLYVSSYISIENSIISDNVSANGGGIYTGSYCTIRIRKSILKNNRASNNDNAYGGGIYIYEGKLNIENSEISSNTASSWNSYNGSCGGGIYVNSATKIVIKNSIISNNKANADEIDYSYGGAIYSKNCDSLIIANSLIIGNKARRGSLYLLGIAKLINSTISDNTSLIDDGWNIYISGKLIAINTIIADEIYDADGSTLEFYYSDIYPSHSGDVEIGTMSVNPQFVDPENGDYHLLFTSPLIDQGTLNSAYINIEEYPYDLDGNERVVGESIDMGAYEYHPNQPPTLESDNLTMTTNSVYKYILQGNDVDGEVIGYKITTSSNIVQTSIIGDTLIIESGEETGLDSVGVVAIDDDSAESQEAFIKINVEITTNVENKSLEEKYPELLKVYPNPSYGWIKVETSEFGYLYLVSSSERRLLKIKSG